MTGGVQAMRTVNAASLSDFARNTADAASALAEVISNLIMDVRDSYRPGLHYMRGPGPKWRAKHGISEPGETRDYADSAAIAA